MTDSAVLSMARREGQFEAKMLIIRGQLVYIQFWDRDLFDPSPAAGVVTTREWVRNLIASRYRPRGYLGLLQALHLPLPRPEHLDGFSVQVYFCGKISLESDGLETLRFDSQQYRSLTAEEVKRTARNRFWPATSTILAEPVTARVDGYSHWNEYLGGGSILNPEDSEEVIRSECERHTVNPQAVIRLTRDGNSVIICSGQIRAVKRESL